MNLSDILNDCKAANLRHLRADGRTVVSFGLSRASDLQAVERLVGRPERHIAVRARGASREASDHVEWIDQGSDGLFDIATGAADLLWADQYLETLWPDEIATFLDEARRLLSPDGQLVLAGVNRELAGDAVRPARAVELTWAEAVAVLTAGGFDITRPKGLLLTRDLAGQPLSVDGDPAVAELDIIGRCVAGADAPERCSGWWVVVRAAQRPADLKVMSSLLQVAARASADKSRTVINATEGAVRPRAVGKTFWEWPEGLAGLTGQSEGAPLKRGRYRATLKVLRPAGGVDAVSLGEAEALTGEPGFVVGRAEFSSADVPAGVWTPIEVEFELNEPVQDFRLRLTATGAAAFSFERNFDLTALFWNPVEGDPVTRRRDAASRPKPR